MATLGDEITKVINTKKNLYTLLMDILAEENKVLVASDTNSLWNLNKQKNDIARDIEEARQELLDVIGLHGIAHSLTPKNFSLEKFVSLFEDHEDYKQIIMESQELAVVKVSVYESQLVNKMFAEEYLKMLDELVGVVSGAAGETYSRTSVGHYNQGGRLLSQEV